MSLDKPNWANKCKATLGCGIRNKCSWNLRGWVQLTSTIQHIIKIGHDFTEVWNLKGQNLIFKSVLLRVSGPALGVCCAGPWFLSINSTNNHDTRQQTHRQRYQRLYSILRRQSEFLPCFFGKSTVNLWRTSLVFPDSCPNKAPLPSITMNPNLLSSAKRAVKACNEERNKSSKELQYNTH